MNSPRPSLTISSSCDVSTCSAALGVCRRERASLITTVISRSSYKQQQQRQWQPWQPTCDTTSSNNNHKQQQTTEHRQLEAKNAHSLPQSGKWAGKL